MPSPRIAFPPNEDGQLVERGRVRVDDGDVVAGRAERLGDSRADAPATDDDDLHAPSSGIGSRTTHTAQGAFLRTYGIVRPMAKSPPNLVR